MKILLYGFKPWGKLNKNISQEIVRKIKPRKKLKKVIFDVKFEKKQFKDAIKKFKPDVIIGLGMSGRGKKIRIERKALNILNKHNKKPKIKILNSGKELFANLRIKKDNNSRISYYAGDYVCNYSIYVISGLIKNKKIRYGFLHIPKTYNLDRAVRFVENIIKYNQNL